MTIQNCMHVSGGGFGGRFETKTERLFIPVTRLKKRHMGRYYVLTRAGRFQKVEVIDLDSRLVSRKNTQYTVEAVFRLAHCEEYPEWTLRGRRLEGPASCR